jgi:hypothetical protein
MTYKKMNEINIYTQNSPQIPPPFDNLPPHLLHYRKRPRRNPYAQKVI